MGMLLHHQPGGGKLDCYKAEFSLRFLRVSSPSLNLYKQDWPHWGSARHLRQAVEWAGLYSSQGMEGTVGKREKLSDLAKKALCGGAAPACAGPGPCLLSQPGHPHLGLPWVSGDSSPTSGKPTQEGWAGPAWGRHFLGDDIQPCPRKEQGLRFPQSMATEEVTQHQPWAWKSSSSLPSPPSSSSSSSPAPPCAGIRAVGAGGVPVLCQDTRTSPRSPELLLQRSFSDSARRRAGEHLPSLWCSWKLCWALRCSTGCSCSWGGGLGTALWGIHHPWLLQSPSSSHSPLGKA